MNFGLERIVPAAALLLFACDTDGQDADPDVGERGGSSQSPALIGQEVSVARRLEDGEEFQFSVRRVFNKGGQLFSAIWTGQEGGGRPLTKGSGAPLADSSIELTFPHNFNRVSAPDANSCAGCHNAPFAGGGGDIVANVFVLGQRFDFATFDTVNGSEIPTANFIDEEGKAASLQSIANNRNTLGMFGSGYIEMLARQMTAQLQEIRDGVGAGQSAALVANGISFGTIARDDDGGWDVSGVVGLSAQSTRGDTPSLVIRPFHQAGAVVSLREFTNNAFNHHHGIQTTERFGFDTDPDGDGFTNEMSVAEVTATSVWQAALPVPGFVVPRNDAVEAAVVNGAEKFMEAGCGDCHTPFMDLDPGNELFSEPNPYNPPGNLQAGEGYEYTVNLNASVFPGVRNRTRDDGKTRVFAFTDLKQHDITTGPDDPNREALDMQQPGGSEAFFAGNSRFLTKKLWGAANEAPFYHHGQYTTMREAIEAHAGEADDSAAAWDGLSDYDRDSIIEFLKTMQVLPGDTTAMVVDRQGRPRRPPWGMFEALGASRFDVVPFGDDEDDY